MLINQNPVHIWYQSIVQIYYLHHNRINLSLATVANEFANIKYDSAFVTGTDIDKYNMP